MSPKRRGWPGQARPRGKFWRADCARRRENPAREAETDSSGLVPAPHPEAPGQTRGGKLGRIQTAPLTPARADGTPMIVTTTSAPAKSQAIAIQSPPKTTQRMLRRSGSGPIASASEIAEFAAQIVLARGNLALHRLEPRFEIAEAAP